MHFFQDTAFPVPVSLYASSKKMFATPELTLWHSVSQWYVYLHRKDGLHLVVVHVHQSCSLQTTGQCVGVLFVYIFVYFLFHAPTLTVCKYLYRASARLLRLSVCSTGNKEIFRYQPSVNWYSFSIEKVSFINIFQHVSAPLTFDLDLVSE